MRVCVCMRVCGCSRVVHSDVGGGDELELSGAHGLRGQNSCRGACIRSCLWAYTGGGGECMDKHYACTCICICTCVWIRTCISMYM